MNAVQEMFKGQEKTLAQFDEYRRDYADADMDICAMPAPVEQVLMPWAMNKAGLFQMFGQNLILTKEVAYNKDSRELADDMEYVLNKHRSFTQNFFSKLSEALGLDPDLWRTYAYFDDDEKERFYYVMRGLMNGHSLIDSRVPEPLKATINGQRMNFAMGQKGMRAIGKVARALGLAEEFESFRIAHSMVLNQAKLTGKLCLSIHPLDYATASDNESGWSSCMSWQEGGSYRLGTVEMMTSPYVICAYLASDSVEMDIGDGTWPSKKWRAWIIVTDKFICVNRNYPYDNEDLMRACVDWVKEMAEEYYGVSYEATNHNWNQGEYFKVDMNYMYNDLDEGHMGCYAENVCNTYENEYINISGPAICMWCGDEIPFDDDGDAANTLTCPKCSGKVQCACCGSHIASDYVCWGPDDEPYCEVCYSDNFTSCDCCGDTIHRDNTYTVVLPIDVKYMRNWLNEHPSENRMHIPSAIETTICEDCLRNYVSTTEDMTTNIYLPFSNSSWNYGWDDDDKQVKDGEYRKTHWNGFVIRPSILTLEQAGDIFNFDPENEYWAEIWKHYAETAKYPEWDETLPI